MDSIYSEHLIVEINTNNERFEGRTSHSINFKLYNQHKFELIDISIYLFVNENIFPNFAKCIKKIPQISQNEIFEFEYNYITNSNDPIFFSRIIYRTKGEKSHRYLNVDFCEKNLYTDSFVALLKIKGLKNIIDVMPITNGVSFTNFGTMIDTMANILYTNYSNEITKYQICKSTLLKNIYSISFNNIKYGKFHTLTLGNSLLLEIPIILENI